MKQGETITISGEFTGINSLSGYTVLAMVYCQNAKLNYKKLLYSSASNEKPITISNLSYSFVIPPEISANLQGECQVEIALRDNNNIAISENYATFAVQNSVLGTTLSEQTTPSNQSNDNQ